MPRSGRHDPSRPIGCPPVGSQCAPTIRARTVVTVRIGVFGTSWWADAMYLPAIESHPDGKAVAACGRDAERADRFADTWSIPGRFTDPQSMLDEAALDAVVIATPNNTHYELAMAAIEAGLHVLCEKPLAMNTAEAEAMAEAAAEHRAITLVPFTYHYMPVNRWVRQLVADGYIGRPLHVNLRYYSSFGHDPRYSWRFDPDVAGTGIIGDLGSHWIHLARWLLDDVETSISATSTAFVEREARPDGSTYEPLEDSVAMTVRYRSGAYGVLQTSAVCWEGGPFGHSHHLDLHGDDGTIYARCDWDRTQEVRGLKRGSTEVPRVLPIPDDIWGGVRRDRVHDTYRDVFRSTDAMTRAWISAVAAGRPVQPDFAEGLAVQRVIDAAAASAASNGSPVPIDQRAAT